MRTDQSPVLVRVMVLARVMVLVRVIVLAHIMVLAFVDTCYVIFALVTRPECPKCVKDEVKRRPFIF